MSRDVEVANVELRRRNGELYDALHAAAPEHRLLNLPQREPRHATLNQLVDSSFATLRAFRKIGGEVVLPGPLAHALADLAHAAESVAGYYDEWDRLRAEREDRARQSFAARRAKAVGDA